MKKVKITALMLAVGMLGSVGLVGCGGGSENSSSKEENTMQEVSVYMPDGAPAMAFAKLMKEDTETDNVTYKVVNPSTIATKLTNSDEEKNADICVLPVTAASKLVGDGTRYQMLGVVTNGNLCVLSQDENLKTALESANYQDVSYLVGKTVGVMKINDLPGVTFKAILDGYGVAWQELKNDGEVAADKVNLKAIVDATSIDPLATDIACYVVAEPAASVQVKKNGFTNVCTVDVLYDAVTNSDETASFSGYPQAVMVAKCSLLQEQADWVNGFVQNVQSSITSLNSGELTGEEVVSLITAHQEDPYYKTTLNAAVLTVDVIARCAVRFADNMSAKDAVQTYLTRLQGVEATAAKTVGDSFFYVK